MLIFWYQIYDNDIKINTLEDFLIHELTQELSTNGKIASKYILLIIQQFPLILREVNIKRDYKLHI